MKLGETQTLQLNVSHLQDQKAFNHTWPKAYMHIYTLFIYIYMPIIYYILQINKSFDLKILQGCVSLFNFILAHSYSWSATHYSCYSERLSTLVEAIDGGKTSDGHTTYQGRSNEQITKNGGLLSELLIEFTKHQAMESSMQVSGAF